MTVLVDRTFAQLLEIVFKGGSMPNQDELAARFGVSRTVVREALSKLEYLNVISVSPGRTGTVINDPSQWKVINSDVIAWRIRAGETKEQVHDAVSALVL